jgi:hypothetical protein
MLDLYGAIRYLRKERDRLDATISFLERRLELEKRDPVVPGPGRRGRRSMSREERRQVSERMRRYWAARQGKTTS